MKKRKKNRHKRPQTHNQCGTNKRINAARAADPPTHPAIYHTLIWLGATATAFTFLGGLQTVVDFSPWASWLLEHWLGVITGFWERIFGFFDVKFHQDGAIPLTFVFSMLLMAFGTMVLEERQPRPKMAKARRLPFLDQELNTRQAEGLAIGMAMALAAIYIINWFIFDSSFKESDLHFWWIKWVLLAAVPLLYVSLFFERSKEDYLHLLILTASMTALYTLMLIPAAAKAKARGPEELWSLAFMVINLSVFLFPSKMMSFVTLAKPRSWNYRMLYVWLTIILILVLDWIARTIAIGPPLQSTLVPTLARS